MRPLIAILLILTAFAPGCGLYESEGRKIFNAQGEELVSLSKLSPLTSQEFDSVTALGFGDCEKIDAHRARSLIHPGLSYYESSEEDYLFSLDAHNRPEFILIVPKLHPRPLGLCFPSTEGR